MNQRFSGAQWHILSYRIRSRARIVALALVLTGGCATPVVVPPRVGPMVLLDAPAGSGVRYLGSQSCRACHPAAFDRWRSTGHAGDFSGLPPADRMSAACLRCHVTGYGEPLGYRSESSATELAAVGCEACHGPGSDHARAGHPDLVPTATGGECPPCEVNRICRLCHTPERSGGFDLERSLSRISCRP